MITDKEFSEAPSKFDKLEKRGSFYDMAVKLINIIMKPVFKRMIPIKNYHEKLPLDKTIPLII